MTTCICTNKLNNQLWLLKNRMASDKYKQLTFNQLIHYSSIGASVNCCSYSSNYLHTHVLICVSAHSSDLHLICSNNNLTTSCTRRVVHNIIALLPVFLPTPLHRLWSPTLQWYHRPAAITSNRYYRRKTIGGISACGLLPLAKTNACSDNIYSAKPSGRGTE